MADVELDTARHRATRGSRDLELTAKEFALLRYFMTHPGQVLSQETLLEHVWDEHADPFTNTVRVTVGTLRRKLAVGDEPQLIDTVVGRGYRLVDLDVDPDAAAVHPVSIRLRLALIYSLVLCLLAALAIGTIYLALDHALSNEPPPRAGPAGAAGPRRPHRHPGRARDRAAGRQRERARTGCAPTRSPRC